MPFSPSDLPWWGWILVSFAAWIVCAFGVSMASAKDDGGLGGCGGVLLASIAGLTGTVTAIMGIILFVKWVWMS